MTRTTRIAITFGLAAAGCNVITPDLLGSGSNGPVDASMDAVAPPTAMLLLSYSFEDTGVVVTDSSDRALNGTLSDPQAWTATGRTGHGVSMSGTTPASQYILLPDGVLTNIDDFTISVWVKLNSTVAWARIYDIGNGLADPANRFMYLTPNGFTANVNDGIHASSYGGSAANESILGLHTQLPTGVWKHLALTGSGGQRKLYIDGFPAGGLDTGPSVSPKEMEPLAPNSWLGRSRFTADPGLDGVMDDFKIYGRELSQTEIADLAWPQHDYSYWRFDDGTGAMAKDSSDNANPMMLMTGVTWTPGRLGGALDLPGGAAGSTGPHTELMSNPLAACDSQLTIAAWIKIHTLTANSRVFDFGSGATTYIYLAPSDGTGMHVGMSSPAGTFDMVTAAPPISGDNVWHHVAVTVDSGNAVSLYVDGMLMKNQSSTSVKPSDFANLTDRWLGKSRASGPYFNGSIDDLRVGCRAFTADEIKNLSRP